MVDHNVRGLRERTRSQATQGLHQESSVVAGKWEKEGRSPRAKLILKEFVLYSGRIGGVTGLEAMKAKAYGDTA